MASTASRPEVRTGTPGKARPSSSAVRRSAVTAARSRRPPQAGQAHPAAGRAHQRQAATPRALPSASGPAQCGAAGPLTALLARRPPARSPAGAPAPAPAHRPASASRAACQATLGSRADAAAGSRASCGSSPAGVHRRRARPQPAHGRRRSPSPSRCQQQLRLGGAREPADQHRRVLPLRAGEQHLPGVRVRRARLGVQIVAVVPDRHQAEVRRPGRTPPPGCRRRPATCPRRARRNRRYRSAGPERGGQRDVPAGAEQRGQGGVQPVQVAGVGHDRHRAPPAVQRRGDGLGEPVRPLLARQRRPHRTRRPALAQRTQERLAPPGSAASPRAAAPERGPRGPAGAGSASTFACRGGTARRSTSARPPAYRSAISRAARSTCGSSTGSGETTFSSQDSGPRARSSSTRSSSHPSTSWPRTAPSPGCPATP